MKSSLSVPVLAACILCPGLAIGQPWAKEERNALLSGCRQVIMESAARDYLRQNNLAELPPRFQERVAPALAPIFASCDCMVNQIESKWSFEQFQANQAEAMAAANALLGGVCAPPTSVPGPQ